MVMSSGPAFQVSKTTGIYVEGGNPEVAAIGEALGALIRKSTEFPVPVTPLGAPTAGAIILRIAPDRSLSAPKGTSSMSLPTRSA